MRKMNRIPLWKFLSHFSLCSASILSPGFFLFQYTSDLGSRSSRSLTARETGFDS